MIIAKQDIAANQAAHNQAACHFPGDNMAALGIASFHITEHLIVSEMNELAEALLQRSRLLCLERQQLQCSEQSHHQLLAHALLSTLRQHRPVAIELRHPKYDELTLVIQPSQHQHGADEKHAIGATSFLVLIRPSPPCLLRLYRHLLNEQFGITTAETEVLSMILRGAGTHEIATQRATSSETIRSQIKALCAKTGSRGQLGLVAFATTTMANAKLATNSRVAA